MQTWTETKPIKEVEACGRFFFVEVELTLSRDMAYGADADGNRGVMRETIEDWKIDAIFDLETGMDVTDEWKENEELKRQLAEKMQQLQDAYRRL